MRKDIMKMRQKDKNSRKTYEKSKREKDTNKQNHKEIVYMT